MSVLLTLLLVTASSTAFSATPADTALDGADLDQNIGQHLPLETVFRDERDERVRLGDYFDDRPVILAPVWYSCPNLCGVTLRGLVDALESLDFRAGRDFQVVAVSIDPRDGVDQAARLESELLALDGDGAGGWHLLTGSETDIRRVTGALGFGYRYDEGTDQYAHPATLALAAADGRVTRYLPGVEFPPSDLRLALLEAGRGELGSVVDRVLLRCFSYDPATGRYTLTIVNVLRVLGMLTVAGMALALTVALLRERRRESP